MTAGLPGQWKTVRGWRMHARVWPGPGTTPVVLVHGLSVSSAYMVRLGEALAVDYPVYAPDLPGFGNSQKTQPGLGLDDLTVVLKDWLDEMKLTRPILVGNSAGCQIITLLAAGCP